jgi:AraC-like DNA-binding protein
MSRAFSVTSPTSLSWTNFIIPGLYFAHAGYIRSAMSLVDHYKMASAFARSLSTFCGEQQINLADAAARQGIDPKCFSDVNHFVGLGAFAALMENLAQVSGNDCFGLEFGAYFKMGDSGPFGFGLANAPNLGAALKFYRDFIRLTADYAFFSVETGQENTIIQWRYTPLIRQCAQYADLMVLLSIRVFQTHAGANWLPSTVSLMRKAPVSVQAHRELMCPAIEFGGDVNLISFSNEYLGRGNPNADPRLFELMQQQCRQALLNRDGEEPLELKIRQQILVHLDDDGFDLPSIARHCAMSERSLQRSLSERGTSYDQLLSETRQELAAALMSDRRLTMEQISEKLGYASPAAFYRAAKKWYGVPPSEIRKSLL